MAALFEIKYQDLQDIAVERLGRNLTSLEIERAKWLLFDLSVNLLDNVIDTIDQQVSKHE